jgi:hypothetical protein
MTSLKMPAVNNSYDDFISWCSQFSLMFLVFGIVCLTYALADPEPEPEALAYPDPLADALADPGYSSSSGKGIKHSSHGK